MTMLTSFSGEGKALLESGQIDTKSQSKLTFFNLSKPTFDKSAKRVPVTAQERCDSFVPID